VAHAPHVDLKYAKYVISIRKFDYIQRVGRLDSWISGKVEIIIHYFVATRKQNQENGRRQTVFMHSFDPQVV
jgi:hypothetical protein